MKPVSLEEMGTGQVVRKEIQYAFNFVMKNNVQFPVAEHSSVFAT